MKTSLSIAAVAALVLTAIVLGFEATATRSLAAEPGQLPGMCNGRSDADVTLNAHANPGTGTVPKFILNLVTDGAGKPSGAMVLGQGKSRLYVDDWCRLWQHRPGDIPGGGDGQCHEGDEGEADEPGTVTAHAVGLARYRGDDVLVRVDVRKNEEGAVFRVRYRAMGAHDHEVASQGEEDGCDDDSWHRIPSEGWAPLKLLLVH